MALKPEELDEPNETDNAEVEDLERCIDDELRKIEKRDSPDTAFEVIIRRGGKPEPNYLVKRLLRDIYLAAGWNDIEFRYKEVPAGDTYWEEFIVKLTRKI